MIGVLALDMPVTTAATRLLGRAVNASFAAAARLRAGKVFHPAGVVFGATLSLDNQDSLMGRAVGGRSWPAVVRASKAVGTPGRWPDVLGMAVRLHHTIGNVDLLFATVDRHSGKLLAPASAWSSRPFSTLLPYASAGRRVVLQLRPQRPEGLDDPSMASIRNLVNERPVTFTLTEAHRGGVTRVGVLTVHTTLDETISFDPVVNQHPGLRHTSLLAGFRLAAYAGSRRGRMTGGEGRSGVASHGF
jgi:hypothetical protein